MTNTTEPKGTPGAAPKKKAKGPFRTEAIIPSLVIIAIVYGYFYFFFDTHLRKGLELAATNIHGAEVNIGGLNTSFWGASFSLRGLEVTDKEKPERNLFEVGEIRTKLLWDALLRMKGVVEDASILDIRAYTKRSHPGYVLPPPKPGTENGILAKAQAQVVAQTRAKLNDNFLGDIAEVLSGVDPKEQLNNIKADLKAVARAEGLEKELKAKKAEWEKRIKELPKPKEVKELEARVKALSFKGNPLQIAQNVKQARDIINEARAKIKLVDDSQKTLVSDINTYSTAVQDLEKMIENDVADLQKRLKLPSIDPKEFSTQLFLSQIEGKLVSVRKYVEVARKYMPPKKTAEQKAAEKAEQLVPPARGQGRTYAFPVTTGYPLFWLKNAAISSEITQSEWAGKVKGQIKNFSTNPSQLGVPLTAQLQGDFPKKQIHGFDLLGTIDHTTENPKESVKLQVASFPITEVLFSDSPKVRFGLKQATGSSTLEASLAGDGLKFSFDGKFSKPEFTLEAKNAVVQDVLKTVLNGIPAITLNADVGGTWERFNFDINSNLGHELSAGFQKQLAAKLGDVKAKLRATVEERMGGAKERAQAALQDLIKGPGNVLNDNRAEMEKSVSEAESNAKPQGGKGGLLKGFGF